MSDDREKALQKLRKCLALGKSSEPFEAAAALRQAQALMRKFELTEDDVAAAEVKDALVKTREGYGNCTYLHTLVTMVNSAFGTTATMEKNPGTAERANVRYIGPHGRVTMAAWAHKVVQRALDDAWAAHVKVHRWHKGDNGKRAAFRLGWLYAVENKIEAIGFTEAEQRSVDKWMTKHYGGELERQKMRNPTMTDDQVQIAVRGAMLGKEFDLHRPLDADGQPIDGGRKLLS